MTFRTNTLTATARTYQWESALNTEYGDLPEDTGWRVVVPEMTAADLDDYDSGWRRVTLAAAKADDADFDWGDDAPENVFDDLAEDYYPDFYSARDQHRADHDPMMCFYWPLADTDYYGSDESAVARAVSDAGCCVLVEVDGEYGIALTGGGKDLSDHIVRAYANAGYMPPLALTTSAYAWRRLTDAERTTIAERTTEWCEHTTDRVRRAACIEVPA